ncbi:MAG: redoxin family protein [bacterium]|nr:redoxin family protein [bacterium]
MYLSPRVVLVFLSSLLLIQSVSSQTDPKPDPIIDDKARQIVADSIKAIRKIDSAKVEIISKVSVKMGDVEDGYQKLYVLAWKRPNLFAWRFIEGNEGLSVVSDGKNLTWYVPSTDSYAQAPAPASITELTVFPDDENIVRGIPNPEWVYLDFFAGPEGLDAFLKNASIMAYAGDEKINDRDAHRIELTRGDFPYTIWIAADDPQVPLRIQPNWNEFVGRGQEAQTEGMSIENTISFDGWVIDDSVDPDLFAFDIPKSARKADSLTNAISMPPLAPDFVIPLMDGGEFSLSKMRGKNYVILDFWATWCPPCRASMPIMEKIAEKYKDKGLYILSLNQQETASKVTQFLESNGFSPNVALDDGAISQLYEVTGFPTFVLIDKDGMIRDYIPGFDPDIEKRIVKMMSGEEKEPSEENETQTSETKEG